LGAVGFAGDEVDGTKAALADLADCERDSRGEAVRRGRGRRGEVNKCE